jgi:hypothetical protein
MYLGDGGAANEGHRHIYVQLADGSRECDDKAKGNSSEGMRDVGRQEEGLGSKDNSTRWIIDRDGCVNILFAVQIS